MRSFRTIVLRCLHGGFADAERTACRRYGGPSPYFLAVRCFVSVRCGTGKYVHSSGVSPTVRLSRQIRPGRPYQSAGAFVSDMPSRRHAGNRFPKGQHKLKSFRISAGTVRTGRLPGRFLRPCRNLRRPVRGIWASGDSLRIGQPAPCRLPHCGQAKCLSSFRSSESRSVPLPA